MKSLREYIDRLDEIASRPPSENSMFAGDNGYKLYEDEPDASRRKFLGKAAATAAGAGLAAAGVKPAQASDFSEKLPPPIAGSATHEIYILDVFLQNTKDPNARTVRWLKVDKRTGYKEMFTGVFHCKEMQGAGLYVPIFYREIDSRNKDISSRVFNERERLATMVIGPFQPDNILGVLYRRVCR